jgi:hypothetical protein
MKIGINNTECRFIAWINLRVAELPKKEVRPRRKESEGSEILLKSF